MELINGNLYYINEEMDNDVFNSYDVVQLLDVMVDTGLALVQLNQQFGIIEDEELYLKTVLVDPRNLSEFEMPEPLPEPVEPEPVDPDPELDDPENVEPSPKPEEPVDPNIEPPKEVEPEPVLPNVDAESEEQQ